MKCKQNSVAKHNRYQPKEAGVGPGGTHAVTWMEVVQASVLFISAYITKSIVQNDRIISKMVRK
jgi:hypothetical protein